MALKTIIGLLLSLLVLLLRMTCTRLKYAPVLMLPTKPRTKLLYCHIKLFAERIGSKNRQG